MKDFLPVFLATKSGGGIERYALDICSYYRDQGWNVMAITRGAKAVDDLFTSNNIPLVNAPLQGIWDFHSIKILAKVIDKAEDPVVIHAHGFRNAFTALAARKLSRKKKARIILTRHKVRRAVDSWILRRIYRTLDAIVFVSRVARDRFIATWHNSELPFPASNIFVIHNSIYNYSPHYQPKDSTGPVTAMFHGPLKPGKGLETLIDAMALLKGKRIRLKIVGSGTPDYLDKLRRRAISRGVMDMIDWHKHTDNPFELIMECDFGVLPSTDEEAFGLSNIEYMAVGRPQICSSNGAQPEYLTDGKEGILIPPANAPFLAENIRRLGSDRDLCRKMGEQAFKTFNERISWPHFIEKLTPIYIPE